MNQPKSHQKWLAGKILRPLSTCAVEFSGVTTLKKVLVKGLKLKKLPSFVLNFCVDVFWCLIEVDMKWTVVVHMNFAKVDVVLGCSSAECRRGKW